MSRIREALESKRFYWYTFTVDIHPLPWHWQIEFTNYKWGYRFLFGPIGFLAMKPPASFNEIKERG